LIIVDEAAFLHHVQERLHHWYNGLHWRYVYSCLTHPADANAQSDTPSPGSVFTTLRAAHPDFNYTALVRSSDHVAAVTAAGATPVIGSSTDRDTILRLVSEADIVLNCMSADDVPLIELILEGLRKRKAEGKGVGVLVHTSGTAVFAEVSKDGKTEEGQKVWSVSLIVIFSVLGTYVDEIVGFPGHS
jgi:hypothetical protein